MDPISFNRLGHISQQEILEQAAYLRQPSQLELWIQRHLLAALRKRIGNFAQHGDFKQPMRPAGYNKTRQEFRPS